MTRSASLMVLGGGAYYVKVIDHLRELGYRTVVVDRSEHAPGLPHADAPHVVDFADPGAVLEVARREAVDGIMALNEFGVRTAAAVAAELGLPGSTPETAELACDKGFMRERWEEAGVPGPPYQVVTGRAEADRAVAELGLPLVMKPTDSGGGGRGVSTLRDRGDVDWAYDFATPHARNGRIIVERFVEGLELTVETLSYRNEVHVLAISDKVKPPLRTRVASSLNYPAAIADGERRRVERVVTEAVRSLGISDGPAHTELILNEDGPHLLELGARGGGGHIFSTIVEAVSGVDMVRETARILTGFEPEPTQRPARGCVYRLFAPPAGVIRAIQGLDRARELPGVLDLGVTKQAGDVVPDLGNSLQRIGYAVVAGGTRDEAVARAAVVADTLRFEMDPLPKAMAADEAARSA